MPPLCDWLTVRRLQKSYDDERGTSSSKGKGRAGVAAAPPKVMWVDKYRPKKFSDLLGEDVSQTTDSRCTGLTRSRGFTGRCCPG